MSKSPKTAVPTDETKRQKFVRLANARTGRAIASINALAKLANKSSYEFSDQDTALLLGKIAEAAEVTGDKFKRALEGTVARSSTVAPILSE